jgi:hypothetical protein
VSLFFVRRAASKTLLHRDFDSGWYRHWAKKLRQNEKHRGPYDLRANKFWQNAILAQLLDQNGALKKGKVGIGFGVGSERLPALFASLGVSVVATDQDPSSKEADRWDNGQLARRASELNAVGICRNDQFESLVSFQPVDMNQIPKELNGRFDFVWSNCAAGHLGSIQDGLNFFLHSSKCLKPGGIAVHTTELNVLSEDETVDDQPTVIFQLKHLLQLANELQAEGCVLEEPEVNFFDDPRDGWFTLDPKFGNGYSKIQVGGHIATQIALVIRRLPSEQVEINRTLGSTASPNNQFDSLKTLGPFPSFEGRLEKLQRVAELHKRGEVETSLELVSIDSKKTATGTDWNITYRNMGEYPLTGLTTSLAGTKPLVLGTANPVNGESSFWHESWPLSNRPCVTFDTDGPITGACFSGEQLTFRFTSPPSEEPAHFCLIREWHGLVDGSEFVLGEPPG